MQNFNHVVTTTIVANLCLGVIRLTYIYCVCAHAFIKHVHAFILYLCKFVRRGLCSWTQLSEHTLFLR